MPRAGFGGEMPFNYFCYGAALSEVELDTLTGDFHLLRTDLCMDVGQSLNPAIDIGQVSQLCCILLPHRLFIIIFAALAWLAKSPQQLECCFGSTKSRQAQVLSEAHQHASSRERAQRIKDAGNCRWRAALCRAWAGRAWRSWRGGTRTISGCPQASSTPAAQVGISLSSPECSRFILQRFSFVRVWTLIKNQAVWV